MRYVKNLIIIPIISVVLILIALYGICYAVFEYSHRLTERIIDLQGGLVPDTNLQNNVLFAQIDNSDILLISVSRKAKSNFRFKDYLKSAVDIKIENPNGESVCVSGNVNWIFPFFIIYASNSQSPILEYTLFVKLSEKSKSEVLHCLTKKSILYFKDELGKMKQRASGITKIDLSSMEKLIAPLYFNRQLQTQNENVELMQCVWDRLKQEQKNEQDAFFLGALIQYVDSRQYLIDLYYYSGKIITY